MGRRRLVARSTRFARCTCRPTGASGSGRGVGFMRKRTSKSASGRRQASSRSGTSGKMAVTGSIDKVGRHIGPDSQFGYLLTWLKSRTKSQRIDALVDAGILTPDKKLAKKY